MKCAICGGELVEGALCSSYPIWFYPLDAKDRPDVGASSALRSLANRPITEMFTVARLAHSIAVLQMVFTRRTEKA